MCSSTIPHGLMFHSFHEKESDRKGQGSILGKDFERLLQYVGIENILSPENWISKLEMNTLGANDLCLTFDDGLQCQYTVGLPILKKYNLKAFWFIYSSVFEGKFGKLEIYSFFRTSYFETIDSFYELFFKNFDNTHEEVEWHLYENYIDEMLNRFPFYSQNDVRFRYIRDEVLGQVEYELLMDNMIVNRGLQIEDIAKDIWLTNDHLKKISQLGHTIGLHSYDHPTSLSRLSGREQEEQYLKNYNHILEVTDKKPKVMAHPRNEFDERTLDILDTLGIKYGFLSNMYDSKIALTDRSNFKLPREDCTNILNQLKINEY